MLWVTNNTISQSLYYVDGPTSHCSNSKKPFLCCCTRSSCDPGEILILRRKTKTRWDAKMLVVNGSSAAASNRGLLFANSLWLETIELHWHRVAIVTQSRNTLAMHSEFLTRVPSSNSRCFLARWWDFLDQLLPSWWLCLSRSSDSLGMCYYYILSLHVPSTSYRMLEIRFISGVSSTWIPTLKTHQGISLHTCAAHDGW